MNNPNISYKRRNRSMADGSLGAAEVVAGVGVGAFPSRFFLIKWNLMASQKGWDRQR